MFAEKNIQRIQLTTGEPYRLPDQHLVYVVKGTAWVTSGNKDRILQPYERLCLQSGLYPALISSAGRTPLVFDVFPTHAGQPSPLRLMHAKASHALQSLVRWLASITA